MAADPRSIQKLFSGAVLIWDASPKEFFEAGVLIQTAGKQLTQMVVEAGGGRSGNPVLLAIDECNSTLSKRIRWRLGLHVPQGRLG